VSFDLLDDYEAGGKLGVARDGLSFVWVVPVVVTDAIEEFPPLSRLTVDWLLLKVFIETLDGGGYWGYCFWEIIKSVSSSPSPDPPLLLTI
jgi:hypothetical protein